MFPLCVSAVLTSFQLRRYRGGRVTIDAVHDHPDRRQSPAAYRRFAPDLMSAINALTRGRRNSGADSDVLALTARWSAALRDRLDAPLAATGSVGRGEATPASDLDVIRLTPGPTPQYSALLADGVTADAEGISPSSTALPTTRTAWATAVTTWCASPAQDRGVVKTGLLADAADPVGNISSAAVSEVPGTPMVTEMLRDALSHTPPRSRGLFRADSLSLKADLLTPVVKIARWASLCSGSTARDTVTRLADATAAGLLDYSDAAALGASYRAGLALSFDLAVGIGPTRVFERHGRVMFSALPGERSQLLRHAVEDLRGIQRTLRYRLSTSSFTEV
jgi:CBS domain-containing protein